MIGKNLLHAEAISIILQKLSNVSYLYIKSMALEKQKRTRGIRVFDRFY